MAQSLACLSPIPRLIPAWAGGQAQGVQLCDVGFELRLVKHH